jgi:hypothetical protein
MGWQDTLKSIAPTLGGLITTAVAGPAAGALVKGALDTVAGALGVEPTEEAIGQAMQAGLSPDQRAALVAADFDYKKTLVAAEVRKAELATVIETAAIADAGAARTAHAGSYMVMGLAMAINLLSYACIFSVLYGCFHVLTGSKLANVDPAMAATVGAVVGSVIQWLMSNAAQANGYCFGSSPSSRNSSAEMARAVNAVVSSQGRGSAP